MKTTVLGLSGLLLMALLAGCGSSSSGGAIRVAARPPSSPQAIEDTKANLRNLAVAEETYLTDYPTTGYTSGSDGLTSEGFTRRSGTEGDTLVAGVDGDTGYCLIGSPSAGDVWILYDSQAGGILDMTYPTEADAEAACSQANVTDYQTIAGSVAAPADNETPAQLSVPDADTQANLRNLAISEESHLVDFNRYTADGTALSREGFIRSTTDAETLLVGVHGSFGYCLVGGTTSDGPWFLYDSESGGLHDQPFTQQSAAEAACSDPSITDYQPIS